MTPEMWLDLEPIKHCASHNFAEDRQKSLGDSAQCCLAGCLAGNLTFYCVKRCHLLSCDGVTVGRIWTPKHFHDLHLCRQVRAAMLCLCGVSGPLMSPAEVVADETARGQHSVLVRALLSSHWSVTDG